ncbi:unnamed protein product [Nezara viridula]|uniref:Uncharacterized protein n=1 Tax=Nezara viridula TaxID=85310 RepID=A0A9P0MT55_NEZVI|nr:unnamed protein product [Nezara viridula]
MIAFIDQEGDEKTVEIELKGDEEANCSLGNMINKERIKINNYYTKLEGIVEKQRVVQVSMLANDARMHILILKERRLEALFSEVYLKIKEDINNISFYKKIFKLLVLQALCLVRYWNIKTDIQRQG